MRARASKAVLVLAAAALAAAPPRVAAQGLAETMARIDDGSVRFTFPTRGGVEICHQGIRMGESRMMWHSRRGWDEATGCRTGPAQVEISKRNGEIRDVEVVGPWSSLVAGAVELGAFPAPEVADYLLSLVRSPGHDDVARDAVFPLVLADVEDVWRPLLDLARDPAISTKARKSALFWVGQETASGVSTELAGVAVEEGEDQEVRDAAVFALSRRPPNEGLPFLMELARTAPQARTRKSALFWLAESGDERVIPFFEEILLGREGGG